MPPGVASYIGGAFLLEHAATLLALICAIINRTCFSNRVQTLVIPRGKRAPRKAATEIRRVPDDFVAQASSAGGKSR